MKFIATLLLVLLGGCAATNGGSYADPKHHESAVAAQSVTFKSAALRLYRQVSPPNAIIFPLGPIDKTSADLLIAVIQKAEEEGRAVLVVIDSPGGELGSAFRIMRAMDISGTPVGCLVDGSAASAGAFVLMGCAIRMATPKSIIMIHGASVTLRASVNAKEMQDEMDEMKVVNSALCAHTAAHTKLSHDDCLAKIDNRDYYLDSREALRLGFIDVVIQPKHLPSETPSKVSE